MTVEICSKPSHILRTFPTFALEILMKFLVKTRNLGPLVGLIGKWKISGQLSNCDLNALGYYGDRFTWASNREWGDSTKERLDRAFGNTAWLSLFEGQSVHHLATNSSYHRLILISMQHRALSKKKEKIFLYESNWSKKGGCNAMVKNAWHGTRSLTDKLQKTIEGMQRCKLGLKQWSKYMHKSLEKLLKSKLNHLKESNKGHLREEIKFLQKEIDSILDTDNTKWQ